MSETPHVTRPLAARAAALSRLDRRIRVEGQISFPAAPALADLYLRRLALMFASFGKKFSQEELVHLRSLLEPRLVDGFKESPHCRVHLKWESEASPGAGIDYRVWLETGTVAEQYEYWASTREPPLFGTNPDAKVMDVVNSLPKDARVLDIGAGTGRNTLPVARTGRPTEALELTEAFVKTIQEAAAEESLDVKVIQGNILDPELKLEAGRYSLIFLSEVTSHFRGPADLRHVFERCTKALKRDGILLLNAFVPVAGYEPDDIARELSQIVWSTIFTRAELAECAKGLPLKASEDEQVHDYEHEHQPAEGWPPTGWFEDWSRGYDLFGVDDGMLPPMDLRWLMYKKTR